jgi:hypothetical protein
VPDDRVKVVEADTPAYNANVRMKRKNQVTPKIPSCHADITNNAYKTATRDKNTVDVSPYFLQFKEERFIILNMAQLIGILVVAFQIPIRR